MGDTIIVTLEARTLQGKKVARLRKQGLVPGVVYGHGIEPILVQAEYGALEKVVREAGRHSPVHATVDGKKRITIIKDIERDPVKSRIRHVAFHAVKAGDAVHAEVPIHLLGEGESEAEKAGLIILQAIEAVEVKAKPADLPEALEVSVEKLVSTEDKILLSDIVLPKGVEYADAEQDLELVVANVYEPAALEAANEAAAGDAEGQVSQSGEDESDAVQGDEASTNE